MGPKPVYLAGYDSDSVADSGCIPEHVSIHLESGPCAERRNSGLLIT